MTFRRWTRTRTVFLAILVSFTAFYAGSAHASGPVIKAIALGDSYSAGVGLGVVRSGCDRDKEAWAPRGITSLATLFSPFTLHSACSGATTTEIAANQIPGITSDFNVAAITAGGNDIGFGKKLKGCTAGDCGPDVYSLKADVRGGSLTWDGLFVRLVNTYVQTRIRMARGGHLFVASYPIPFARQRALTCSSQSPNEQNAVNALVTRLGDTIYWAVDRANKDLAARGYPGNVHFLDWRTGTRVEGGYTIPRGYEGAGKRYATYVSPDGLCNTVGRNPFINGYRAGMFTNDPRNVLGNSFHPNSTGYGFMSRALAASVKQALGDPFGSLDAVTSPSTSTVHVAGWASDPNDPLGTLAIRVSMGATVLGQGYANQSRSDVSAVYPNYGSMHGFDFTVSAPGGSLNICLTAINVGGGSDRQLGCKSVDVEGPPPPPQDYGTPGTISIDPCLDLHDAAGHTATIVGCIPNQTVIKVQCQVHANLVTGPWGTTDLWDRTYWNGLTGFVADAFVYTGSNAQVAPSC